MNYFSHAIRFLDNPWFSAGCAVPDWLSVADRKVRMRSARIKPLLEQFSGTDRQIAEGILQHLHDDDWFHATPGFALVTGQVTTLLRDAVQDPNHWCSFVAHILTELLLDSVLDAAAPQQLERYYAAIAQVDPEQVQSVVNRCGLTTTTQLAPFITLFCQHQFLFDYRDSERLLYRMNQVMNRVGHPQLPEVVIPVFDVCRTVIAARKVELLPPELFRNSRSGFPETSTN